MHDLPAWATDRKRPRHYVIGRRRCRQRLAQGLAAGRSPRALAALNRLGESEVELLLEDESFQDLVAHYRTLAQLPEAEKLAALRRKALDLMELALDAGDVRVAIFFAYEELHGRDPGLTLAKAAVRTLEREAARTAPVPERRPASRPPAEPRREADFPYCAATQGSPGEAAALAAEEARRFESRLATTRRGLTGRLLAEAEREGTAGTEPLTEKAEAFARGAHEQGGQALTAAAVWQARRDAFAAGGTAAVEEADGRRATLSRPSPALADPVPRLDRGIEPKGDEEARAPALSFVSSPGVTGGPASPTRVRSGERSATAPAWVPGQARDDEGKARAPLASSPRHPGPEPGPSPTPASGRHQESAAGTAAPLARDGPPPLPDWLDLVPALNRAQLLAMPEKDRALTLRTIARFYGFETG
jgi:hypothetical protein